MFNVMIYHHIYSFFRMTAQIKTMNNMRGSLKVVHLFSTLTRNTHPQTFSPEFLSIDLFGNKI